MKQRTKVYLEDSLWDLKEHIDEDMEQIGRISSVSLDSSSRGCKTLYSAIVVFEVQK